MKEIDDSLGMNCGEVILIYLKSWMSFAKFKEVEGSSIVAWG